MTQEQIKEQIERADRRIAVLTRRIRILDGLLWFVGAFFAIWLGLGVYWALTGRFW